ncbi:hypothetical protein AB3U99_03785 [Niallia sp. JL1B1071]
MTIFIFTPAATFAYLLIVALVAAVATVSNNKLFLNVFTHVCEK